MPRKQKRTVRLELTPLNLVGKLMYRVTALIDETPLHMSDFNLGNDRNLASFLRKVEVKAKQEGVTVDLTKLEVEILQHARTASLGIAEDSRRVTDRDIPPSQVLTTFGLTVLGEHQDQAIRFWSENTKKVCVIRSPSNWKEAEVLQCIGPKAAEHLWLGTTNSASESTFTLAEIQRAIALAAAEAPRITSNNIIGQGVWPHRNGYLIVDGASARMYDGESFKRLTSPRIDSKIIEFDPTKKWHGSIAASVQGMDATKTRALAERLCCYLNAWNWTHDWDARVAAALAIATFVQAIWQWRPLVSITGPSDCGKTTLFQELLLGLFLDWAIYTDRSTEAGIRQAIAHSSTPVLIDEFDKYQHRQRVLELFRTASRGGKMLRGTADQTGQQFTLNHIGWFAAIESGDIWGQDRNRFIPLGLLVPSGRAIELPAKVELAKLGRDLAAAAIWAGPRAVQIADAIKDSRIDGIHGRLIESFSVPAAIHAVLLHGREARIAQGRRILEQMIGDRQQLEVQGEPDELQLLRDILSANLRVNVKQEASNIAKDLSVGQLLEDYRRFHSDLEAKGVRIIAQRGANGQMLFIAHDAAARHLLPDTRWQNSRIDQILMRIDGAQRMQQRCAGSRPQGVAIPWPQCLTGGNDPVDRQTA